MPQANPLQQLLLPIFLPSIVMAMGTGATLLVYAVPDVRPGR